MSAVTSYNELQIGALAPLSSVAEPLSDHLLLEAIREGDEDAFAELVRRYRNQITSYIYRLTNDYDNAVDLSQETFIRIYRAADRYQATYAFSTYIYRIATNLAITELRKRKRQRLISLTSFFLSNKDETVVEFDPADEHPLQDAELVENERQCAIKRAIESLPSKYRVPVVLRDVEGRSYEEIAQILGLSEGTVKSRINRARNFLRDKLKAYL
jgi:RNA polymerase sigma-70 factor, ECF subfamily